MSRDPGPVPYERTQIAVCAVLVVWTVALYAYRWLTS